jgi:glycosyltransferase involved in cell wall biosynthesis
VVPALALVRRRSQAAPVRVREVFVVLPADVDDPARPSGGNTYDRRICAGLADVGWSVRRVAVPGSWPRPGDVGRARLAAALAAIPDGATVLLDGIVACGVPEVIVPQAQRLRAVVLVHLPLADETGLKPADAAALDAAERRTLRAAAAVVATGSAVADRLVVRHGVPRARVWLATPGVDPAPPASGSAEGGRLLCVASVTPRKGHDVLVRALAQVADQSWFCVCAGPHDRAGGFAGTVRHEARTGGPAGRVVFPGACTAAEVADLYAGSDLVVLPSRAEPYGMVVTEALARGVPVLASDVDGIPEALGRSPDGELPGMLVPPGDPVALAAALRAWLGDPGLRAALRAAARARRRDLPDWAGTTVALAAALDPPARDPHARNRLAPGLPARDHLIGGLR